MEREGNAEVDVPRLAYGEVEVHVVRRRAAVLQMRTSLSNEVQTLESCKALLKVLGSTKRSALNGR